MMKKLAIPTREGMVDVTMCSRHMDGKLNDSQESCDHHDCNNHGEQPVYVIPSFKK